LDEEGRLKNKRKKIQISQHPDNQEESMRNDLDELDIEIIEDQEMIEDLRKEMDLPEGALVTNLFIPLMVVCSKVDLIQHGEPYLKQILENNLDFIQYSLRKFALAYGASLVFASTVSSGGQQTVKTHVQNLM
jgi:hypothetical protein